MNTHEGKQEKPHSDSDAERRIKRYRREAKPVNVPGDTTHVRPNKRDYYNTFKVDPQEPGCDN